MINYDSLTKTERTHTHLKTHDVRTATNKPVLAFQFVPAAIVSIWLVETSPFYPQVLTFLNIIHV